MNLKHCFGLTNISAWPFVWLIFFGTNFAHADAGWATDSGVDTPAAYRVSPQSACDYVSIGRFGTVVPYRIAWVLDMGVASGLYKPGFDVAGPPIPNPKNNYSGAPGSASMYCIFYESLAYWLFYSPDPKPRKIIAIDPGHGYACASKNMLPGAIGVTDFPVSDPPPGYLKEDELTMEIALELKRLASAKYTVVLTKNNVDDCPKFEERGEVAIKAKANVFVSIHINARNFIPKNPFGNGTSVIWNYKRQDAQILADLMAPSVSASLGVNNQGAMVDNGLAVLKATVTPRMVTVLVEAARLSGDDEKKLHAAGSATKVAAGIKAALDAYFGN